MAKSIIMKSEHEQFFEDNKDLFSQILENVEVKENHQATQKSETKLDLIDYSILTKEELKVRSIAKKAKRFRKNPVIASCSYAQELDYMDKINGESKGVLPPRFRKKEKLLEYSDQNKREFFNRFLKPRFLNKNKQFVIDEHNKLIIDELFKYFIQHPDCKLDLYKGIYLCGNVGTGKTSLMSAFSEWAKFKQLETAFDVVSVKTLTKMIEREGMAAIDTYKQKTGCFDDIATRKDSVNSFGTKMNVTDEIIQSRYLLFDRLIPKITHATSNVDLDSGDDELLRVYDERSIDRANEMFNFLYLGGKSRR